MNNRQLFSQHLGQTSEFPLSIEIDHAQGLYMYESGGKSYMDLISGIGVSSVGHRHPVVIAAIQEQTDKYLHLMVYGEFVEAPQVQLAKSLVDTLPSHLNNVFLVNSGSEATEGALKLAKRYTGKTKIVSCSNAYHGSTSGALSVCGDESLKQPFRPLLPETYRVRFGKQADLEIIDKDTAAVIIEPVQGEAGVRLADQAYFEALRKKCDEVGCLLIYDEVQCGVGRTGKFWAFEHYGVEPDILLTAKGVGGGMPIGAFISSKDIMHKLTHDPILGHISTFGGHPVSAAAANATVRFLSSSGLIDQAEAKGQLFKSLLVHPKIKEVRGKGLMLAMELESFDYLKKVIDHLIEIGYLTDWFLFCDNSMRIAPPLIIEEADIRKACQAILETLDQID
ncbi:aspartate aminotransferase family protein [Reichenbachiella ulvae]|uniref:Aspartate aminotransferase family protein n=1 Tax=Reichenbachiella ulvae TaxID=2980104 RepID=A0ABT3CRB0_9BACT|nr:aspartate aminotransferase family protein [Reichenbachiella ulvae]MCV9386174.1 aspartate aminotransferase family protein [Reichenbachiella ulvae]